MHTFNSLDDFFLSATCSAFDLDDSMYFSFCSAFASLVSFTVFLAFALLKSSFPVAFTFSFDFSVIGGFATFTTSSPFSFSFPLSFFSIVAFRGTLADAAGSTFDDDAAGCPVLPPAIPFTAVRFQNIIAYKEEHAWICRLTTLPTVSAPFSLSTRRTSSVGAQSKPAS